MADDRHRMLVAEVQAQLSQGRVYRDRNFLIRHEIAQFLEKGGDAEPLNPPHFWWMSKFFLEAFVDIPRAVSELGLELDQLEGLSQAPKFALFHWIATAPSDERESAMEHYEAGSNRLIAAIQKRIARLADQRLSMRQRVYSAALAIDEMDRILTVCQARGLTWASVADLGERRVKRIMQCVPTYQVEIALTLRIEGLERRITLNDLRDMHSYVAAIPKSDVLVGEKLFINLAIQAGLNKKYGCHLHTKMYALEAYL